MKSAIIPLDKRSETLIHQNDKKFALQFCLLYREYNLSKESKPLFCPLPNFASIYLNISDVNFIKASDLLDNSIMNDIIETENDLYCNNEEGGKNVFDFFEATITSLVFAYMAVEHVVNSIIPNNIVIFRKDENNIKIDPKTFIERKLPLEYKIKKILPQIYKCSFNLGNCKFWPDFKKLQFYRNELVHLKSHEIKDNISTLSVQMSDMVVDLIKLDVIESARDLIKYLHSKTGDIPGYPREFLNNKISVESFNEHFGEKKIDKTKDFRIEIPNEIIEEFLNKDKINFIIK